MAAILDLCKFRELPKPVIRATTLNLFYDHMEVQIHQNFIGITIPSLRIIYIECQIDYWLLLAHGFVLFYPHFDTLIFPITMSVNS